MATLETLSSGITTSFNKERENIAYVNVFICVVKIKISCDWEGVGTT
jgi:hypothetical protein